MALTDLIRGIPVVVMMLILNILLPKIMHIAPMMIAVIVFSLDFGVRIAAMLSDAMYQIGGLEAAVMLGYTPTQTFWKITLPQAAEQLLPAFCEEYIAMAKMTAVVGCIAVQDLTSAAEGQLLPLLITAVIYLIIVNFIEWALDFIWLRTMHNTIK